MAGEIPPSESLAWSRRDPTGPCAPFGTQSWRPGRASKCPRSYSLSFGSHYTVAGLSRSSTWRPLCPWPTLWLAGGTQNA